MNGKVTYRETSHTINGVRYVFQRVNGTVSEPDTHRITIYPNEHDSPIELKFRYFEYALFAALVEAYGQDGG